MRMSPFCRFSETLGWGRKEPANAMYRVLILEYKQAYDSLLSN